MKKLLILFIVTLLFYGTIWAQCPTGNVYFYTQSDIDNFAANYPGCTQMPGSNHCRRGFGNYIKCDRYFRTK